MASSVFHYCYPTCWTVTATIPECILIYNWYSNILLVELLALTKTMSPRLQQKRSFTHSGQVSYTSLQMVSSFSLLELAKDNAAGDRCNHCFWVSRVITDESWLFLHFRCLTLITFFPFFLIVLCQHMILWFSSPPPPKSLMVDKVVDDLKVSLIVMIGIT